jgi:outer membrane lipoprotein-sorting protein
MIGHSCPFLEELPYFQTMYYKRCNMYGAALVATLTSTAALLVSAVATAQPPQPPAAGSPSPLAPAQAPPGASPSPVAPAQAPPGAPPAPGKAAEPPQEPPTEAERIIDLAIKKLAGLKSVSADLVQNVVMLKQRFDIKGRYLKAPSSRTYLKLAVSGLADGSGTVLQVCDGETLWDYQEVLESRQYRKLSVKPILERLNSPEIDAATRDLFLNQVGFAGPDALLVGLRKSIKFDQKEEDTVDGKPVWVLRGTWRDRKGLMGPDSRPLPATGPLPAYVPSRATVYLGKDDGWPYRMDLIGKVPTILVDTRRTGADGKVVGSRRSIEQVEPSEIRLVYSNVKLDTPIRPAEFAFEAPANASVEDNTDLIIKGLNQAIELHAMQKRAEATRQEGPVLDQPIDIPKPPTDPTPK